MRKILFSLMTLVLVVGMVGGGAFAYLRDSVTSTGNTFTAGTLDLELADANEFFGPPDSVTATWVMPNMTPGVTTVGPLSVSLLNTGTIAADHVEISFSDSIDEVTGWPGLNPVESDTNPNSVAADLAEWIEITSITYNGVDLMPGTPAPALVDANGNGFLDLDDVDVSIWPINGSALDNLVAPPPNSGGITTFTMALAFNAGATDDIQGDTLTTTVTFTLNQDSSQ